MPISDQDYELLSAYLDGALKGDERASLEARLSTDAELRRELAALRGTVGLLKTLPNLKAPRDFTLTNEMVGGRKSPRMINFALPLLSAAAALLLVVVGVGLLLSQTQTSPTASNVAQVASATVALTATNEESSRAETLAEAETRDNEETGRAAASTDETSASEIAAFALSTAMLTDDAVLQEAADSASGAVMIAPPSSPTVWQTQTAIIENRRTIMQPTGLMGTTSPAFTGTVQFTPEITTLEADAASDFDEQDAPSAESAFQALAPSDEAVITPEVMTTAESTTDDVSPLEREKVPSSIDPGMIGGMLIAVGLAIGTLIVLLRLRL